jgi:hypothetical protein
MHCFTTPSTSTLAWQIYLHHDTLMGMWLQGKVKEVDLRLLVAIHAGQATAVFRRHPQPDFKHISFSLVYDKGYVTSRLLCGASCCLLHVLRSS